MWTVISKTKKAIPGLAKILLAVILLGSIGFAVYVQHLKKSYLKLDLDASMTIPTDSGLIKFNLSSKWEKITDSESPLGRMEIWSIPGDVPDSSSGFFYLNLTPAQLVPESQFALIARQNSWLGQVRPIKFAQNTESTIAFPNFEVLASFQDSNKDMLLATRMIYLPNGMTISMSFLTSSYGPIRSDYWLEELAQQVQFIPNDKLQQVRGERSKKFELSGLSLQIPPRLWVQSEADGGMLYLQPVGRDETDRWQARIKPLTLPEIRKPRDILSDFFFDPFAPERKIGFSEPSKVGGFNLYQGAPADQLTEQGSEYHTYQFAYLLYRIDGKAILTTLTTTPASQKQAQETLRKIFASINAGPMVTTAPTTKPTTTSATTMATTTPATTQPAMETILTPRVISDRANEIAGWFLVKQNNIRIGFEATIVTAIPGKSQPNLKVVSYSFFDTGFARYQEDVRWQVKLNLTQAGYESHVKTQFEQRGRPIGHVFICLNEVTPESLVSKIKLDKDVAMKTLQRPGDFLPNGSDQILINLMGQDNWTGPNVLTISEFSDFQPQLETIEIRREKNSTGQRKVFVLSDFQTDYSTHVFDKKGRWLGFYNSNGFSITRTSGEEIQRLYPQFYELARQRLGALAGGERPDREKK
jgi:hypothetical protein